MVKFFIGYNRFSEDESTKEIFEKTVKTLNELFHSKECPHHPQEKWSIEVDLMRNGKLQFASQKVNGCSYMLELLEKDVYPFLDRQSIFPLELAKS